MAFDAMGAALRRGVGGQDDASLLQSPLEMARSAAAIMREQRLSVFKSDDAARCRTAAIVYGAGWNAPEPQGRWMAQDAHIDLPACECEARATVYLPEGFAARTLHIEAVPKANTGTPSGEIALVPGSVAEVVLPASAARASWRLHASRATVPTRDLAGSTDQRTLGALMGPLHFACATSVAR
jgi:hypothetical protein